jgi:DNA-binding XRE family transcriptional regulator
MSQTEFAAVAGVSRDAVSRAERGSGETSLRTAQAFARALDLTVEELFPPDRDAAVSRPALNGG